MQRFECLRRFRAGLVGKFIHGEIPGYCLVLLHHLSGLLHCHFHVHEHRSSSNVTTIDVFLRSKRSKEGRCNASKFYAFFTLPPRRKFLIDDYPDMAKWGKAPREPKKKRHHSQQKNAT